MTGRAVPELVPQAVVELRGEIAPDLAEYARQKVAGVLRHTGRAVLHVRIQVERHRDPARERPVTAQANVDLDGTPVSVHVAATKPRLMVHADKTRRIAVYANADTGMDAARARRFGADGIEAERHGVELDAAIGTMIELPRAALTAGQIAESAEFFSFGTNDLTQTTWGFSRDDVEGAFFSRYLERGIFGSSPFETLDIDGVGRLIKIAAQEGRATRPDIRLGVCGEHGGDPDSIHFFHHEGLDYVSCSPFRVPVARLEAGRAALDLP